VNADALTLRPATADDVPGIIALVDAVYREYGDRVHLDDADRDLPRAHQHYAERGGELVVLVDGAQVVGLHAVLPLADRPGVCTFRRLYLAPALRGGEWGERLMRWALARGKELGCHEVEFWSDTRFARAHRFFARLGFVHNGQVRELHDAWEPYREYHFRRAL
jgi:putative acetyltransferase